MLNRTDLMRQWGKKYWALTKRGLEQHIKHKITVPCIRVVFFCLFVFL